MTTINSRPLFLAFSSFFLVSQSAHAVLPKESATAFTAILADAQALEALAWPTLIGITTIFVIMKLFKRAANKAT